MGGMPPHPPHPPNCGAPAQMPRGAETTLAPTRIGVGPAGEIATPS